MPPSKRQNARFFEVSIWSSCGTPDATLSPTAEAFPMVLEAETAIVNEIRRTAEVVFAGVGKARSFTAKIERNDSARYVSAIARRH